MINRTKGTQDFLDLALFNFVVSQISDHLKLYHFSPIATPLIEPTKLFQRSLGEETDVITKEMFTIKTDEKSEPLCLRPEATASTVRAFIENRITQIPWKVYSYGPMFRYERPQKGRYRQFHQFNIEVIGSKSLSEDVQFIVMLDRLFHEKFSLDNYALKINYLGDAQDRKDYEIALKKFLKSRKAQKICETCKIRTDANTLRVFDCKVMECQQIYTHAPKPADFLNTESKHEWEQIQQQLEILSVSFSYDPHLVRGLDYYNKTVFEFVSDDLGAQNAFCGGGRYDQLVRMLGGKEDQPSVGAAIGMERLLLLLETRRDALAITEPPALTVVIPLTKEQQTLALLIADTLRADAICTDVLLDGSVKSMMRKANKMGASYAILIGEEEQNNQQVTIKSMLKGTEERISQVDIVSYIKK